MTILASSDDGPSMHSVDEFVFCVPDLDEARSFYTAFGLDVREYRDGLALHTYDHPHRWARVLRGATKRLLSLSVGILSQDELRFSERLARHGRASGDLRAGG